LFRLFKLGIALMGFLAFAWFGATVKLGSQTLFEHLHAIGQTKESQELVDGTKQAAAPLVDDVRRHIASQTGPAAAASPPDGGAPEERLSTSDQHELRRLLRKVDR
jgi:hypothetical protein